MRALSTTTCTGRFNVFVIVEMGREFIRVGWEGLKNTKVFFARRKALRSGGEREPGL